MIRTIFGIAVAIACGICLAEPRVVQCTGQTVLEANTRIVSRTPFFAIFKIDGDIVTMTEGDSSKFAANEYKLSSRTSNELTFATGTSALSFFIESGRFKLIKMDSVGGVIKIESSDGECKKFQRSDAFK